MSHIETRSVEIANFNKDLALQAVTLMAKDHGFEIQKGDTVKAMYGSSKAEMVIKHPKDGYSIGLNFSKGKLDIVGEFYNNTAARDQVQGWIKAYYTSVAYGESMKKSGEFEQVNYSWDQNKQEVMVEGYAYN